MRTRTQLRDLARELLAGVHLEHFVSDAGVPTPECWRRLDEGTLSTGESVLVAVALDVLDYSRPFAWGIGRLLLLDSESLARVARVLAALSEDV